MDTTDSWLEDFRKKTEPLRQEHERFLNESLGKWSRLPEEEKLWILQAVCHIMVDAESKGISHRGLIDELGVYPAGFWVSELMTVHNALWSEFHVEIEKGWSLKDETKHTTPP